MNSRLAALPNTICTFAPPYDRFVARDMSPLGSVDEWRGTALIWKLRDGHAQKDEFEWLHDRPFGLPLVMLLPRPQNIGKALPLLTHIRALRPRVVVPEEGLGSPIRVKQLLMVPPRNFAEAVASHLEGRGLLRTDTVQQEVRRILELSSEVQSISALARRMYTSRRTLGRHFAEAGLPVPSHLLQFARLLHVAIHLQNERCAIFRIAHRAKYPDGFTMSNQMKRIIGCRPSEARACIGWEWIVESWLRQENLVDE